MNASSVTLLSKLVNGFSQLIELKLPFMFFVNFTE